MRRPLLLVVGPLPPPPHGISVYVRMLLGSAVLRERWRVSHLDTSDPRSLENLGRVDLHNVRLGLIHATTLAWRMVRERPDVVWIPLSQNAPAFLRDALFVAVARLGGARVVGHLHGSWLGELHRAAAPPLRWVMRVSCGLLAQGWVLGEGLRQALAGLVPSERVRVVPNGVPHPGAAAEERGKDDPFTILYLGQLSRGKGVEDLLEAFARLPAADPPSNLVLAGGWLSAEEERRLTARIAASPARARIRLEGVVEGAAKARLLGRAHALALPARSHEGQPLVVLEAMAAGLPVVATPRGAIPDMVEEGVTGRLVPEGDVDALADALASLRDDPAHARSLGVAGRARWEARFTEGTAMRRVVDEIGTLVPTARRGRLPESAPAR